MRELDTRIAQEVFGFRVWAKQQDLQESHPDGDRSLPKYSKDMNWAWVVAEKMKMALIPIEGGQWFAFVGHKDQEGWPSPQALFHLFEAGDFAECGAAVNEAAPIAICEAALAALEKRKFAAESSVTLEPIAPELLN